MKIIDAVLKRGTTAKMVARGVKKGNRSADIHFSKLLGGVKASFTQEVSLVACWQVVGGAAILRDTSAYARKSTGGGLALKKENIMTRGPTHEDEVKLEGNGRVA